MKVDSFSKWIVRVIIINGLIWIWGSYILSWFGRAPNEELSKSICNTIILTVLTYFLKAGVENVSKHTNWPRPNISREGESCKQDPIATGKELI